MNSIPKGVRETGRVFRSKMGAPACSSSLRIIALSEGWAMCSFSAALLKLRSL